MSVAIEEENVVGRRLSVRALSASQIDAQLFQQWQRLEDRAVEPNPFLSPHFILPALRHLTPNMDVVILVIESECAVGRELVGRELVGLGVFERSGGTMVAPFPHWSAYVAPRDTNLTNVLVDRSCSCEVLTALFDFLTGERSAGQCVEFTQRSVDSPFGRELVEIADEFGMQWIGWQFDRPILRPGETTPEQYDQCLSRSRRQKTRAKMRRLEMMGVVTFDVVWCGEDVHEYAGRFLRLENKGWKGAANSSLASHPASEAFFHEMTEGFGSANRVIVTELRLDDRVIGSTMNFAAGRAGFGYKIGWDPEFQKMSPGILQALELARACNRELPNLDYFDSGTDMNNFVASLWPAKHAVTSGAFVSSHFSKLAVAGMLEVRLLKRKLKRHLLSR